MTTTSKVIPTNQELAGAKDLQKGVDMIRKGISILTRCMANFDQARNLVEGGTDNTVFEASNLLGVNITGVPTGKGEALWNALASAMNSTTGLTTQDIQLNLASIDQGSLPG